MMRSLYVICNLTLFLTVGIKNTMTYQEDIIFKKVTNEDIPLLLTWFNEPHVNKWWPVLSKGETIEPFLKRIRSENTFGYIVCVNNVPIGYIQYYYIDRTVEKAGFFLPELPAATVGTDQFIGDPNYINKGYGTKFIKAFIDHLSIIEPLVTTIVVDPEPVNYGAIKCYEKVGFKRIGDFATRYGPFLLMRYDKIY